MSERLPDPLPSAATPRPKLAKWEIRGSDFAIFAALLFSGMGLLSLLFQALAESLLGTDPETQSPLLVSLAANFGMQLGMLAAYLGFRALVKPQASPQTLHQPSPPRQAIVTGLKWLAIAYPVMIGINLISRTLLGLLGYEQVIQDPIRMVQEGGTLFERTIMYGMIILVAPICEEAAFRGGIFRYLHHRAPLYVSLGLSASLFALLHANLYSFAPLMTIGVMLALAYRESGSLVSCIVFHSAFNAINLLLILSVPYLV